MSKKKATKSKLLSSPKMSRYITHPKLILFLFVLLMIPVALFGYNKYKDWDNAQLIKGLHRDFPVLVGDIEQATGLVLEQKVGCSITTEKFSTGVRTCELSVSRVAEKKHINQAIGEVKVSSMLSSVLLSETGRTYSIEYRNKGACSISNGKTIYITCITAVREANIDLARELFINNQ